MCRGGGGVVGGGGGEAKFKDCKSRWSSLLMEKSVLSFLIYLPHCDIYYDEFF